MRQPTTSPVPLQPRHLDPAAPLPQAHAHAAPKALTPLGAGNAGAAFGSFPLGPCGGRFPTNGDDAEVADPATELGQTEGHHRGQDTRPVQLADVQHADQPQPEGNPGKKRRALVMRRPQSSSVAPRRPTNNPAARAHHWVTNASFNVAPRVPPTAPARTVGKVKNKDANNASRKLEPRQNCTIKVR